MSDILGYWFVIHSPLTAPAWARTSVGLLNLGGSYRRLISMLQVSLGQQCVVGSFHLSSHSLAPMQQHTCVNIYTFTYVKSRLSKDSSPPCSGDKEVKAIKETAWLQSPSFCDMNWRKAYLEAYGRTNEGCPWKWLDRDDNFTHFMDVFVSMLICVMPILKFCNN